MIGPTTTGIVTISESKPGYMKFTKSKNAYWRSPLRFRVLLYVVLSIVAGLVVDQYWHSSLIARMALLGIVLVMGGLFAESEKRHRGMH